MTVTARHRQDSMRMADWGHLKFDFIWAYEGPVATPYLDTREHHQGQSALLLQRGDLRIESEHGRVTAKPGDWVFPREGNRLQRFSPGSSVLSVHYNLYWPGNQPLFDFETAFVLKSSDHPQLERLARALCRQVDRRFPGVGAGLPWRHGHLSDHLALQRHFAAWLHTAVEALRAAGASPTRLGAVDPRVMRAVQLLDELRLTVTLDQAWLARQVRLSVSQLDRLFSAEFGLTPRQYFERRKIERTKDLLRTAPMSIKQIAFETGFRSQPYFSRWFRQRTGMSARAYQKLPH